MVRDTTDVGLAVCSFARMSPPGPPPPVEKHDDKGNERIEHI